MNPIILSSLAISGVITFGLVALLIKKRYNLLSKKPNVTERIKADNQDDQTMRDYRKHRLAIGKKYPDDFLDSSGGIMGI